jgi:transcriptional regulator with XRE-family HTH domain
MKFDKLIKICPPEYEALIRSFTKRFTGRIQAIRDGKDATAARINSEEDALSHAQMAKIMNLNSKQHYRKIELLEQTVTVEHILKMSVVFGCSTDYLLTGAESEYKVPVVENVEVGALKDELNRMLKEENERLKKENTELKKENERLKARKK